MPNNLDILKKANSKAKNFLVSTADFALFFNEMLACTGTVNLNTSMEVTMQEQNINAGKGNKLVYSYKYGRELNFTLEAANWDLRYLAVNLGNNIDIKLDDVYDIYKCITINNGIGVLPNTPIGNVDVEISADNAINVVPDGNTIDLKPYGVESGTVNVTYKFKEMTQTIVIDAETSPKVYKLVLTADKHNNKLGKVGTVQIEVPSFQPSGNFNIDFTPDGVSSTTIEGKALAVEGDTCDSGNAVYAYVRERSDDEYKIIVSEIVGTPGTIDLDSNDKTLTASISVIGIKGSMYSNIELENSDCTFVSDTPTVAIVDEDGTVVPVATGTAIITISYGGISDEITVNVA